MEISYLFIMYVRYKLVFICYYVFFSSLIRLALVSLNDCVMELKRTFFLHFSCIGHVIGLHINNTQAILIWIERKQVLERDKLSCLDWHLNNNVNKRVAVSFRLSIWSLDSRDHKQREIEKNARQRQNYHRVPNRTTKTWGRGSLIHFLKLLCKQKQALQVEYLQFGLA